jgi:ATP-dependent Clp protease adapter protein ClpS
LEVGKVTLITLCPSYWPLYFVNDALATRYGEDSPEAREAWEECEAHREGCGVCSKPKESEE